MPLKFTQLVTGTDNPAFGRKENEFPEDRVKNLITVYSGDGIEPACYYRTCTVGLVWAYRLNARKDRLWPTF